MHRDAEIQRLREENQRLLAKEKEEVGRGRHNRNPLKE